MNRKVAVAMGLSLVPIIGLALLLGFAAVAAQQVGHWPYYSHPDPKDVRGAVFFRGVSFALLVLAAATVVALYALLMTLSADEDHENASHARAGSPFLALAIFAVPAIGYASAVIFHFNWLID